jgi:hypothetical protein
MLSPVELFKPFLSVYKHAKANRLTVLNLPQKGGIDSLLKLGRQQAAAACAAICENEGSERKERAAN